MDRRQVDKQRRRRRPARNRGVAAILAMMFLVIFSSLAAAMAIVAQGNLSTAEAHLRINRSMAGAETGMQFVIYRLNEVTANVQTRAGLVDDGLAQLLWYDPANPQNGVRTQLFNSFAGEFHNIQEPQIVGDTLQIGPIAVGPNEPTFVAYLTPHPLSGENYDSDLYQRAPYSLMDPPVSNSSPLDATWVRVKVICTDGPAGHEIKRAIQMDFKMAKKIRYAILSKSRVMIGRNVMIDGPIGSRFTETHLPNGHPIQMVSDFAGINSNLDGQLQILVNTLHTNDVDHDNRLAVASPSEMSGISNPGQYDKDGDGYIDEYDFFLAEFDNNADGAVTSIELDVANDINRAQLMELIDTFGDPARPGYNDGVIDDNDMYAKVRGDIKITALHNDWESGAAGGVIQDHFRGPIQPGHHDDAVTFGADPHAVHDFAPGDFNVQQMKNIAVNDLAAQAASEAAKHNPNDPTSPQPLGTTTREEVPFGAAHPYDYYERPVYENMTFRNVRIPKGSNALFKNCRFIGCTFVESAQDNDDPMFNYAGMEEPNGTPKHLDKKAQVYNPGTGQIETISDTKTVSNNVRFHGCTFEGAIATDAPDEFTHVRNKLSFTGTTRFKVDDSQELTDDEKQLYRRSTILAPHYSVDMGTFIAPFDSTETVELSGTIVAGIVDMRGQVKVNGSVVTTFEPKSDTGPVIGPTSPQFNTTLGYFPSSAGDMESELPLNGVGVIQVRYDPNIPLPDGILGPIEVAPEVATYTETKNTTDRY